jgi:uncharacterized protein YoaH (UPF0181 family)
MNRTRRHAKAARDLETQHRLWTVRIQELVASGLAARQALVKLAEEVTPWIAENPQRKAARQDAWNAFNHRIPK